MAVMRQPLGLVTSAPPDHWWIAGYLHPALGQIPLTTVDDGRGGAGAVEAVVYSLRLAERAVRMAQELAERACGWCGELVATERCPFCHMHGPTAVA